MKSYINSYILTFKAYTNIFINKKNIETNKK